MINALIKRRRFQVSLVLLPLITLLVWWSSTGGAAWLQVQAQQVSPTQITTVRMGRGLYFENSYCIVSFSWAASYWGKSDTWYVADRPEWKRSFYVGPRLTNEISRDDELRREVRMGNGFNRFGIVAAWQHVTARHGFNRGIAVRTPWLFVVPAILISSLIPSVWIASRRAKLQSRGLCPACGYDLRATPDRCPECGRVGRMGGGRVESLSDDHFGRPHD